MHDHTDGPRPDSRAWEKPYTGFQIVLRAVILVAASAGIAAAGIFLSGSPQLISLALAVLVLCGLPLGSRPLANPVLIHLTPVGSGILIPYSNVGHASRIRYGLLAIGSLLATAHFIVEWVTAETLWRHRIAFDMALFLAAGALTAFIVFVGLFLRPTYKGKVGLKLSKDGFGIPDGLTHAKKVFASPTKAAPIDMDWIFTLWSDVDSIVPTAIEPRLVRWFIQPMRLIEIGLKSSGTTDAKPIFIPAGDYAADPEFVFNAMVHLWKHPEDRTLVNTPLRLQQYIAAAQT